MALKPTDMLEIQSAIDEYERKFPRRPTPSAEAALAWRLGKRALARWNKKTISEVAEQANSDAPPRDTPLLPWVKPVLLVGWWSFLAVAVASVFFFGALVGGFK